MPPLEHRSREPHRPQPSRRAQRAAFASVGVGAAIMLVKFFAWIVTGSSALFADAAESIVNVIAGVMVTYSVFVAARPADADHPYGHGKAESLSAAVEGAMIVVAATVIIVEAIREITVGPHLQKLGFGMAIAAAAGLTNLALGAYLLRTGRREGSEALEADGLHVMTDVLTTAGAVLALLLVRLTGVEIIDPLAALAVAASIVWTGSRVVRRALGSLLDRADFGFLSRLAAHLERARRPEWVEIHQLRAWSSGTVQHVDLHLAVPRYLSIDAAHREGDILEAAILELVGPDGDAVVHLDPCRAEHCGGCMMRACPIRSAPAEKLFPFDVDSLTKPGVI